MSAPVLRIVPRRHEPLESGLSDADRAQVGWQSIAVVAALSTFIGVVTLIVWTIGVRAA